MVESVYSAVRTDSLCKADYVSSLKGSDNTADRFGWDHNIGSSEWEPGLCGPEHFGKHYPVVFALEYAIRRV